MVAIRGQIRAIRAKRGPFWGHSLSEALPEARGPISKISGLVILVQMVARGFGGIPEMGGRQNTPNHPKMDISVCRFWDQMFQNRTN